METATLFASSKSRWTDNELMSLPNDGRKYELIDGDLLVFGRMNALQSVPFTKVLVNHAPL